MQRYFIDVAYKGSRFQGFQIQQNGKTIQGEVNKALETLLRQPVETTTSSRTDAGVHAHQNYLHLDLETNLPSSVIYNLNALLDQDIVIHRIQPVESHYHSRFHATARSYSYHIIQQKNPFLKETAYYFPFKLNKEAMTEAASFLLKHDSFECFAKKHSDVHTFRCNIFQASWHETKEELIFRITSNRFLRGMVRAIVGTLLQVGREKITPKEFEQIILNKNSSQADFSAEAKGLFLEHVYFPADIPLDILPDEYLS